MFVCDYKECRSQTVSITILSSRSKECFEGTRILADSYLSDPKHCPVSYYIMDECHMMSLSLNPGSLWPIHTCSMTLYKHWIFGLCLVLSKESHELSFSLQNDKQSVALKGKWFAPTNKPSKATIFQVKVQVWSCTKQLLRNSGALPRSFTTAFAFSATLCVTAMLGLLSLGIFDW